MTPMQPDRPDEVTGGADDREASMTARSWRALSVTAAAAGAFSWLSPVPARFSLSALRARSPCSQRPSRRGGHSP